ncbi:MAG: DUF1841 family protein [Gammaproteobacteria bacterium]|nr:DUF1841 family protein [Gammaproteobacteria bacterium]
MLFSHERNDLRQVFFNAWNKHNKHTPLEPMEQIIVQVIKLHPEYHHFFENSSSNLNKDFSPEMGETNPFLHLSMHIAIHEQLSVNQPQGITGNYKKLLKKTNDPHETEHELMDCLGEMIWLAQRENKAPDEKVYMDCIKLKLGIAN